MSNSCAVVGYVPPPNEYRAAAAFLENIRKYRTHYPLILFSDYDYGPKFIRLRASPAVVKDAKYPNGQPNKWSLNNLAFLSGIKIAQAHKVDYILYVEADCRVRGDEWDKVVFDEFFQKGGKEAVAGGSIVAYQPCNRGLAFAKAWRAFIAKYAESRFVIPAYGGIGASEQQEPAVFPNGALAIYKITFLESVFPMSEPTVKTAANVTAFDYHLGRELVRKHGDDAFKYLVHLDSVYSGYGDVFYSEKDRQGLLQSGQVVGSHQIKSDWAIDDIVLPKPQTASEPPKSQPLAYPAEITREVELAWESKKESKTPLGASLGIQEGNSVPVGGKTPQEAILGDLEPVCEATAAIPELMQAIGSVDSSAKFELPDLRGVPEEKIDKRTKAYRDRVKASGKPKVTLLIVTHAADVRWLGYCLRSIEKFASGFHQVMVICPEGDEPAINAVLPSSIALRTFKQKEAPYGHLHHQTVKCMAFEYDDEAEYFLYLDSDCVLTEPITPADYFVDGKPVLLKRSFAMLEKANQSFKVWKPIVEAALRIEAVSETMVRHPSVHPARVLSKLAAYMHKLHGKSLTDYVLSLNPKFPAFSEFCVIGAYALQFHKEDYHWIDVGEHPEARPKDKLYQFWSHLPPEKDVQIWHNGSEISVTPSEIIAKVLG